MVFDASNYSADVARILALEGDGYRLAPLVCSQPNAEAAEVLAGFSAQQLFPAATHPDAAMAGLWLYFSCFDQAHNLADSILHPDGYFWHAIVHRQEPDAWNSSYWWRKVGSHPVFPALAEAAAAIHPRFAASHWDPNAFVQFCEDVRLRNPANEPIARQIQRAEWQLLFDHCASPASQHSRTSHRAAAPQGSRLQ